MNDKDRNYVSVKTLEAYQSLRSCVEAAGGAPDIVCSPHRLQNQSAIEFLSNLAINNIYFVWIGEEK